MPRRAARDLKEPSPVIRATLPARPAATPRILVRLAALALLVLAPAQAGAQSATPAANGAAQAEIVDYGIYDMTVTGYVPAPNDVAQSRFTAANVRLARKTTEILAQPHLSFGIRYRITDPALIGAKITARVVFPKMTNPKTGQSATSVSTELQVPATGEILTDFYRFDYRWEMAEGVWAFQVVHEGKVIAEQRFKVILGLN
jgi:hypothetical protein